MKKSIFTLFSLAFLGLSNTYAQVGVGTNSPDASAALEVQSTTQGFLPPRMTETDRQDIITPAAGLIIYCTDCGSDGELQVYNGAAWTNVVGAAAAGPAPTQSVINTFTQKEWMDRNLGASQVAILSTDAASYGDLYQWGRAADGHQIRTSGTTTTLSSTDTPGHGDFILTSPSEDWRATQNDNLWQGVNGVNNPCPSGYRLPTDAEWNDERLSWVQAPINSTNNADGAFASPLKLPVAGGRLTSTGSVNGQGGFGNYWSSTVSSANSSYLYFYNIQGGFATVNSRERAFGGTVRCLKD